MRASALLRIPRVIKTPGLSGTSLAIEASKPSPIDAAIQNEISMCDKTVESLDVAIQNLPSVSNVDDANKVDGGEQKPLARDVVAIQNQASICCESIGSDQNLPSVSNEDYANKVDDEEQKPSTVDVSILNQTFESVESDQNLPSVSNEDDATKVDDGEQKPSAVDVAIQNQTSICYESVGSDENLPSVSNVQQTLEK